MLLRSVFLAASSEGTWKNVSVIDLSVTYRSYACGVVHKFHHTTFVRRHAHIGMNIEVVITRCGTRKRGRLAVIAVSNVARYSIK